MAFLWGKTAFFNTWCAQYNLVYCGCLGMLVCGCGMRGVGSDWLGEQWEVGGTDWNGEDEGVRNEGKKERNGR